MDENALATQSRDQQFVLHPHRSLTPRGFVIVMAVIGAVSFAAGVMFVLMGAWPVTGFFGLDVGLIYWAFKANFRSGRMFETIDITPQTLTLTRVDPKGRRQSFNFNSYWVRVLLTRDAADGRNSLRLAMHGREVPFGQFLTDDERAELAPALTHAIMRARGAHF